MIEIQKTLTGFVPKEWLEFFDVTEINELPKEWQIKLIEKETLIPKALEGKMAVLDGFLNPVELEDFPLRGKTTYLKFFRRRWKEAGSTEAFHNEYDFHLKGMKATREFGAFLKDLNRRETDFFFDHWPDPSK